MDCPSPSCRESIVRLETKAESRDETFKTAVLDLKTIATKMNETLDRVVLEGAKHSQMFEEGARIMRELRNDQHDMEERTRQNEQDIAVLQSADIPWYKTTPRRIAAICTVFGGGGTAIVKFLDAFIFKA